MAVAVIMMANSMCQEALRYRHSIAPPLPFSQPEHAPGNPPGGDNAGTVGAGRLQPGTLWNVAQEGPLPEPPAGTAWCRAGPRMQRYQQRSLHELVVLDSRGEQAGVDAPLVSTVETTQQEHTPAASSGPQRTESSQHRKNPNLIWKT